MHPEAPVHRYPVAICKSSRVVEEDIPGRCKLPRVLRSHFVRWLSLVRRRGGCGGGWLDSSLLRYTTLGRGQRRSVP